MILRADAIRIGVMSAIKPMIPTLSEIRERMLADVAYYFPASGTRPVKSVLSVLVTVVAGAVWSLYGFADWILRQIDPLTASEIWLAIWGARLGVPRKPATFATGNVRFLGAGNVPVGTVLQAVDQRRYVTQTAGAAGNVIAIQATTAGYAQNIPLVSNLTLVNPIAGIEISASASPIIGGLDQETLASWAQRISDRLRDLQKIGDADDYARWAKQAHTAILDAWVYGNTPLLGDITIYCLLDPVADAANVLPQAQLALDRIANVGCRRILRVPDTLPISIRIADIAPTLQAAISDDIAQLILSKRTRKAFLYPEEIERLVANHTDADFTLLAPTRKLSATDTQIMSLAKVVYE